MPDKGVSLISFALSDIVPKPGDYGLVKSLERSGEYPTRTGYVDAVTMSVIHAQAERDQERGRRAQRSPGLRTGNPPGVRIS